MTGLRLTDEEMKKAVDDCYAAGEHVTVGQAERAVADAQLAKVRVATLKEVGEWLELPCPHNPSNKRWACYQCGIKLQYATERGEMPKEGKS